jgi:hypothetical protein
LVRIAFLTVSTTSFPEAWIVRLQVVYDALDQRLDDGGVGPLVEFLHEALGSFLFGHMVVPFGKLECFGGKQLALLAAR